MCQSKPPLLFSHANSFPAATYRQFLAHFKDDYDVGYIDTLGHNAQYPVTDGWPHLVSETLDFITHRFDQPVVAVGHSLGGFLSFMAALQRPDLFRAVVLLDSPIFSRSVSNTIWLAKQLGLIERLTPGKGTQHRRREWPSVDDAYQHFLGRGMFASFTPACLHDFVVEGTVPTEHGVRLRFDPEIEYRIYCGLPHHFPTLRGQLTVSTGFIGGTSSRYVKPADLKQMDRHFSITRSEVEGGHLFPFECPAIAAEATNAMIHKLLHHDNA